MTITSYLKLTVHFLSTAFVVMCIAVSTRAQLNGTEPPTTRKIVSDQSTAAVYQRWLDEEVRWIITPQERAGFLRLSKDEDRDRFVESFWLRRDPTPGTQENEFKEEHYRRLAYANTHFAHEIPGWRTDRGRIYIVYGQPERTKSDAARRSDSPAPNQRKCGTIIRFWELERTLI